MSGGARSETGGQWRVKLIKLKIALSAEGEGGTYIERDDVIK